MVFNVHILGCDIETIAYMPNISFHQLSGKPIFFQISCALSLEERKELPAFPPQFLQVIQAILMLVLSLIHRSCKCWASCSNSITWWVAYYQARLHQVKIQEMKMHRSRNGGWADRKRIKSYLVVLCTAVSQPSSIYDHHKYVESPP